MKTFLEEVAEKVFKEQRKLEEVTMVFPNRRAALYFRKHLSGFLTKPAFPPRILTIQDFIQQFSDLQIPDKLILISILFGAYRKVLPASAEDSGEATLKRLEHFYFWGEMLLRDFDEADKYLIAAGQLFKDLSHQKELDASFDFLTEEQQEFLKDFWGNFDENQSVNKKRFLQLWRSLGQVYEQFKKELLAKGLAYEGMQQRRVAEKLSDGSVRMKETGTVIFAGFNALTAAEEKILTWFVDRYEAQVYWDIDAYYVNNVRQEAGRFFREYQENKILSKTFSHDIPSHFQEKSSAGKEVQLFGAPQSVGQAKVMAQVLKEEMLKGLNPEETLIVLPDEKLLMPVLHGISATVGSLNVSMGFPLSSSPLFNFIELLIDLQITRNADYFNHRQVLGLLGHPYMLAANAVSASAKRKEIIRHNWVHIPRGYLASEVVLHRLIFRQASKESGSISIGLVRYLQEIVREVGSLTSIGDLDKEYAFHFMKFFNVLETVLEDEKEEERREKEGAGADGKDVQGIKSFLRLFRQLVRMQKIPFSGEPLKGLQVMGVLETRNLDFKNVFILSLNEGSFPASGNKGSYIPHNIRKAYGLPTFAHQDAMYAYLFYRTLQRAENIFLFYNSETDVLGQGEMSRYLQQLLFESGWNIQRKVLHNSIQPKGITPVVIEKNESVFQNLLKLNEGSAYFKGVSPSALNSYIECRLQFYFRHVARIREADEVEEELDARVLGNFLHHVMEKFYKDLAERKGHKLVEKEDFKHAARTLDLLIDEVFISTYKLDPDKPVDYAGQRLVVREVVKRFAVRIIQMDEAYAPFTMEALEQDGITYPVAIEKPPYKVVLGGKIDRVDRKGDVLRIIDYKTGKDQLEFDNLASLFSRDGKRNKAAFQTLLYALMYVNSASTKGNGKMPLSDDPSNGQRVVPGLINRMNLFDDDFTFGLRLGRQQVNDVTTLFPEFKERLKVLFEELYDPAQPFDQTTNTENCKYCPYSQICYR